MLTVSIGPRPMQPVSGLLSHLGKPLAVMPLLLLSCHLELSDIRCLRSSDCATVEEVCIDGLCQPTERPRIRIVSPPSGAINAHSAVIQVEVANFTFDPAAVGGNSVAGRGHWHIYVDGNYIMAVGENQARISRLPNGTVRVGAQLAENNHDEIPNALDEILLEVREEARDVRIVEPAPGPGGVLELVSGEAAEVAVDLTAFTLDPERLGSPPDPCSCTGHLGVYLNGQLWQVATEERFSLDPTGLDPDTQPIGSPFHELEVRLLQHDDSDVEPPVFDIRSFSLRAPTGDSPE